MAKQFIHVDIIEREFFKSFSDDYLLVYTDKTVWSFIFIALDSLIVVFTFFPFSYFKIILALTPNLSRLFKEFCPFIYLFF